MLPAKQRSERSPPTVSQRPAVETSLERAPSPLQVLQTLLKGGHGRARARSPARGHHSGAAQPAAGTGPPPRRAKIPAQLRGRPAVRLPEAGSGRWRWLTLVRAQVQTTRCKFQSLLFGLQLPTTLKSGSAGDPPPPPTLTRAHGARARRQPQPGFEIGTAQEFWPPVACALQARVPAPVLQVCSCSPCLPHELPDPARVRGGARSYKQYLCPREPACNGRRQKGQPCVRVSGLVRWCARAQAPPCASLRSRSTARWSSCWTQSGIRNACPLPFPCSAARRRCYSFTRPFGRWACAWDCTSTRPLAVTERVAGCLANAALEAPASSAPAADSRKRRRELLGEDGYASSLCGPGSPTRHSACRAGDWPRT